MTTQLSSPAADPVAFVAEAERMTNERDVESIGNIFASDARWRCVIDGLATEDRGLVAIAQRWRLLCGFMSDRGLLVEKELVAVGENRVVNRWQGRTRGRARPMGTEIWTFNSAGLVEDQLLTGFLNPRSETSPAVLLGLAASQPVTALTFARRRLMGVK
ncbi:DUF1348 family protein [Flexivirga meconopsidis]|uniref:DUF1348 family protein n=1 Tax=Flexivirga meconopsidis TaxID=2977121 RepID=UPI00223F3C97|nr:DUF1348 family protein [Flexivirga meconopsidis]